MNPKIHRVYFLVPDLKEPSGGIQRIYRYANYLQAEGYRVFVVHGDPAFGKYPFAKNDVPIIYGNRLPAFEKQDVILVPEVFGKALPELARMPCRKVMVALNYDFIFAHLPEGTTWNSFGIANVITNCQTVARFIRCTMGLEATVIRPMLDLELYYYDPVVKKDQIAHIGRKDVDSGKIINILLRDRERFGLTGWNVMVLESLPEADYARALRESRMFLNTSLKEGIPMPILEALACGCELIGYTNASIEEQCARLGIQCKGLFRGGDQVGVLEYVAARAPVSGLEEGSRVVRGAYTREDERCDLLEFFGRLKP
jgi:hypothetical protein